MSDLKSEAHYGLALSLGGGELTMQELVSLYAMLANNGEFRPIALIQEAINKPQISKNPQKSHRIMSEEAAFIALDILRQNLPRY